MFRLQFRGNFIWAAFCGITRVFEVYSPQEWELAQFMPKIKKLVLDNVLECPMPGLVVDIRVQKGDRIYSGEELVIVESMKMESGVASPCDGEVLEILVERGQANEETGTDMINADELISVAESLPLELKTELIERLLNSLSPSHKDIDELWAEEAEKRVQELRTGKVKAIPGEDVFREILENLSK